MACVGGWWVALSASSLLLQGIGAGLCGSCIGWQEARSTGAEAAVTVDKASVESGRMRAVKPLSAVQH